MTTQYPVSHEYDLLTNFANRLDSLTTSMTVPKTPRDLPSFGTATRQLSELTQLVNNLSLEALSRSATTDPLLGRVANEYASAVASAGRAAAHYAHGYAEHRFFRSYTALRDVPDFRDARAYAFAAVQERMGAVQEELTDTRDTLRTAAARLDSPPPGIRAARSRSTQSKLSTVQLAEATEPSYQPSTPPPGPRRAR